MTDEADDVGTEVEPTEPHLAGARTICPIVGIGASAGGVAALRRLFPNVAPGCDMAFVVVQHLDPDHGSALAEVVARSTSLPVAQIEDDTAVAPNRIYVIPPNSVLTIRDGRLLLAPPATPRGQRNPIDEFFTSLARDQGENAACVILSGTGSDGTLGLRAIKEGGGLTLAQSEAEYDGMMRSAVATGLVDYVMRAEEMPAKLVDYFTHKVRLESRKGDQAAQPDAANYLAHIAAILRAHTGHDFSSYKDRTIVRRVQRRMHVLQIDDVSAFIDRLQRDKHEVMLLFQDLLIGVTHFFRDPDAFATLEREVVPNLFKNKGPEDTVRVWVPGCATGEEAYSVAILLRECAPKSEATPKLQVFASDIDEHALDIARIGRYPATIAKDVPQRRLERYFLREDGTYRIASDLREICLFWNAFLGRLAAMGRTHDLLTKGAWSGTSLRSLLEVALEPHLTSGRDGVELTGPDVRLTSGQATTLGMVFHELATNASKYGALSNAGGHVAISWKLLESDPSGHRRVELSWTEQGGPPTDSSRPSGFGTGFILRSVEYELTGEASLDFLPEGVRCTIKFPLAGEFDRPVPDHGP